jgi:hypothetical protein
VTARLSDRLGPGLRSGDLLDVHVVDQVLDGGAAVRALLTELGERVGLEVVGDENVPVHVHEPRPEQAGQVLRRPVVPGLDEVEDRGQHLPEAVPVIDGTGGLVDGLGHRGLRVGVQRHLQGAGCAGPAEGLEILESVGAVIGVRLQGPGALVQVLLQALDLVSAGAAVAVVEQVVHRLLQQRLGQAGRAHRRDRGGNRRVPLQLLGRAEQPGGELSSDGAIEWSHGPPGGEGLDGTEMMARMPEERVEAAGSAGRLAELVTVYARRGLPAVLEQHPGASVWSALGVWLLLAACAGAARGPQVASLEEALGCSCDEAADLLAAFLADRPAAVRAAIAVWVAAGESSPELAQWLDHLPDDVESGALPSREEADAWVKRETLGLIRSLPVSIDELTRVVLASALATHVSWEEPFGLVDASVHMAEATRWRGAVSRMLWDARPQQRALIARTEKAGLVAVHLATAREDLTVVSVSAAPDVRRAHVLGAAHSVSLALAGPDGAELSYSLYDLALGAGHSWDISEREVPVFAPEARLERIAGAALPAWYIARRLALEESPRFGTAPALEALLGLIGPRRTDLTTAVQTAAASFTRYGFEAAAVTTFAASASAARLPTQHATERSAVLRFDHPYAVVAVAGRLSVRGGAGESASPARSAWAGLPVFTAWVDEPDEPEGDSPDG